MRFLALYIIIFLTITFFFVDLQASISLPKSNKEFVCDFSDCKIKYDHNLSNLYTACLIDEYKDIMGALHSCEWNEVYVLLSKSDNPDRSLEDLISWLYFSYKSYLGKYFNTIEKDIVNFPPYKGYLNRVQNYNVRFIFKNCPQIKELDRLRSLQNTNSLKDIKNDYKYGLNYLRKQLYNEDINCLDLVRIKKYLFLDKKLAYQYLNWCKKIGDYKEGIRAIQSIPLEWFSNNQNFLTMRQIYIRNIIYFNHKDMFNYAYFLAAVHPFEYGMNMINMEWLAGWIALEYLNEPGLARRHFQTIVDNCKTPLSHSRGLYWLAKSNYKLGYQDKAMELYNAASQYKTTFYGQLALYQLNKLNDFYLYDDIKNSNIKEDNLKINLRRKKYVDKFLYQDIYWLSILKENRILKIIVDYILSYQGDDSYSIYYEPILNIAAATDNSYLGLITAKTMFNKDKIVRTEFLFPTEKSSNFTRQDKKYRSHFVNLTHSIIKQESSFDSNAVSPAGAIGLMQVMPNTAKFILSYNNLYNKNIDLFDPECNFGCGIKYLVYLGKYYEGKLIPVIASYNAGEHNIDSWLGSTDGINVLNSGDVDKIVNWIESIPFYETRNYVMRVLENMTVYNSIISHNNKEMVLNKLLTDSFDFNINSEISAICA